jgi:GNAT superfamily N-acetyltransferase
MSSSFSITVRPATIADIPILVSYRRAMFESMGIVDQNALSAMCAAMSRYLSQALPGGEYHGWVAEAGATVIASGGLVIHHLPPSPRNMDGREGYIMNIYTEPEWRRKGVATVIVSAILDYLRSLGVPVATLHATQDGRPVYERLGFEQTNEMRLIMNRPLADLLAHNEPEAGGSQHD